MTNRGILALSRLSSLSSGARGLGARWALTFAALLCTGACDDGKAGGTVDAQTATTDAADATVADDVQTDAVDATAATDATVRADVTVDPSAFCQGTTHFAWDPTAGAVLSALPDDALTRDDPKSLTRRRVALGTPAWLDAEPTQFQSVWKQLEDLDGWGTSAGIMLHFDGDVGALPTGTEASLASDELALYELGDGGATRIPYETQLIEQGATAIVWPMHPLRERTLHALVLTSAHHAADGGCVAPSAPLVALVSATATTDPAVLRLGAEADRFFAATGVARESVSAIALFTTQDVSTTTLAQRDDLRARSYDWKTAPACQQKTAFTYCKGTFDAKDYRREGYLGDAIEPPTYTLPVRAWLPKERTGPVPTLVFGHGLGGDANQAAGIAELVAPLGIAVVALPAPRHGDHPTARHDDPNAFFLDLFGLDMEAFAIDGFVFRENVRQAAFDKLQMMQLLEAHPDVDGDGVPDLDTSDVAYWGISLGGIMGSDFSALCDRVGATVLSIPGARVLSIVTDAAEFASFKELLAAVAGSDDAVARLAPVGQALVDGGDPVNWATHVLRDRVDDRVAPDVLVQMVMNDGVVPNIATRALVRALGVDVGQVPPVLAPIEPLVATGRAPVSGNLDGQTTAGLFELDRVTTSAGGKPVVATHGNVFSGIEAIDQVSVFLETWVAARGKSDAAPQIVDPYARNQTRPLE